MLRCALSSWMLYTSMMEHADIHHHKCSTADDPGSPFTADVRKHTSQHARNRDWRCFPRSEGNCNAMKAPPSFTAFGGESTQRRAKTTHLDCIQTVQTKVVYEVSGSRNLRRVNLLKVLQYLEHSVSNLLLVEEGLQRVTGCRWRRERSIQERVACTQRAHSTPIASEAACSSSQPPQAWTAQRTEWRTSATAPVACKPRQT